MRKALCCGLNYVGTAFELRGCINDADDWAKFLAAQKFDVGVLAEKEATRRTMMIAIGRLVRSLKPKDVGFLTYSGHGTWVPDTNGDEADGRDEAICPIDMGDDGHNLIIDDELGQIYKDLAPGATLVVVFDSCHSGSAFRGLQVGDPLKRKKRFINPVVFGHEPGTVARVLKAHPEPTDPATPPGLAYYAGCRDDQYANDAVLGGRACGAFSHFLLPAFKAALANGKTYQEVYNEVRRHLPSPDFNQTPQFTAGVRLRATKVFS